MGDGGLGIVRRARRFGATSYYPLSPIPYPLVYWRQSQYTKMKSPSHTTSTKCQYQATPSNAKWCVGVK